MWMRPIRSPPESDTHAGFNGATFFNVDETVIFVAGLIVNCSFNGATFFNVDETFAIGDHVVVRFASMEPHFLMWMRHAQEGTLAHEIAASMEPHFLMWMRRVNDLRLTKLLYASMEPHFLMWMRHPHCLLC